MLDPWPILGLNAASANEADVRSAYARLIKLHRPDTDPPGFQQLRQAYEAAVLYLRAHPSVPNARFIESAPVAVSPAPVEPPANRPPPAPAPTALPAAFATIEDDVRKARAINDEAAIGRAIGQAYRVCSEQATGLAAIQLWQHVLRYLSGGQSDLVAIAIKTPQLMDELEQGQSMVTHAIINVWLAEDNLDRLSRLADSIKAESERLTSPEAAVVALRLAFELGFQDPTLATNLVNFAFPNLDREKRDQLLPQAEQQIALGTALSGLRDDQYGFWRKRFREPGNAWDWTDREAASALEHLVAHHNSQWPGYAVIRQIVPPDWWQRLEKARAAAARALASSSAASSGGNFRRQKTSFRHVAAVVGFIFFVIISGTARFHRLPATPSSVPLLHTSSIPQPPINTMPPVNAQSAGPTLPKPPQKSGDPPKTPEQLQRELNSKSTFPKTPDPRTAPQRF